jgi:hypothetical protein
MEYRSFLDSFSFLNFNTPACKRLIRRAFTLRELPSLIGAILSSKDENDTVRCLHGDDAQAFIDVIDEVRLILPLHYEILLIEIDFDAFCRPDAGQA